MKTFEEQYIEFEPIFEKYSRGSITTEAFREVTSELFKSFFIFIKEQGIEYADFLEKEFKELFEQEHNGNPLHFNFGREMQIVYTKLRLKFEFLVMLADNYRPAESFSTTLLFAGNKLLDANKIDAELYISRIYWIVFLLRFYKNEKAVDLMNRLADYMVLNWFTMDLAYYIIDNLNNYRNKASFEVIKKFSSHHIERLAEYFTEIVADYKKKGLVDTSGNWIGA